MAQVPYAIQIKNVSKQYHLGQIGGRTLRGDLSSWWANICGKEDPNLKIGSVKRIRSGLFYALNNLDLTIKPGEAVGIIGRNGAGKSTLLKLLSQVTAPTSGTIDIYGRISSMLEVGTGFHGEMTGRENIYMNGAILGMSKAEIDAKMENIIEFSEVGEFIDTPVKRYSSGMYVKLAFSVAAHLDSEIMIMDEVLAVGDMAFQKKCLDKMKESVSSEGRTVLYVSHNMETIRKLCNRCIVLDEGRIIFDGEVEEAIKYYMGSENALKHYREYELKDYFIKDMPLLQIISSELDRVDCQYDVGDKINVTLKCKSIKYLKNVHLRFQLLAKDSTRVGSMFTSGSVDIDDSVEKTIKITMPTDEFVPGQYFVEIAFYTSNEHSNNNYINTIKNGFSFEINPTINKRLDIGWYPVFGYSHFADMSMKVIENVINSK